MATSLLAFHLPAYYLKNWIQKQLETINPVEETTILYSSVNTNGDIEVHNASSISQSQRTGGWIPEEHYVIIRAATVIAPLWFGANCFYNYSLLMTSVSSSTIIRQFLYSGNISLQI
jgi:hypothetical protein